MGKFGWSYPPGAANDPYAPYNQTEQPIDLTERLQGMGKRGHGLCGKDADLDYGGQIKVIGCWLLEESVEALLDVYASICEPCQKDDESDEAYESRKDAYGDVVATWSDYPGEWTGSDYWCFWLANDEGNKFRLNTPFTWNDEETDEQNYDRAVTEIHHAIFSDPAIKAFQENMTELAKAGE